MHSDRDLGFRLTQRAPAPETFAGLTLPRLSSRLKLQSPLKFAARISEHACCVRSFQSKCARRSSRTHHLVDDRVHRPRPSAFATHCWQSTTFFWSGMQSPATAPSPAVRALHDRRPRHAEAFAALLVISLIAGPRSASPELLAFCLLFRVAGGVEHFTYCAAFERRKFGVDEDASKSWKPCSATWKNFLVVASCWAPRQVANSKISAALASPPPSHKYI